MITDTVQCKSCYNYATPGHTCCRCGPGDEGKKQVLKKRHQLFQYAHTKRVSLQSRKTQRDNNWSQRRLLIVSQSACSPQKCCEKQYKHIFDRYQTDEKISTEASVARYNRREKKNGTVSQKHQKENTSLPQQSVTTGLRRTAQGKTAAGERDTTATTKHPDLQQAKDWRRENVRPQGSNTFTQPQSSHWQWQDWSGWRGNESSALHQKDG